MSNVPRLLLVLATALSMLCACKGGDKAADFDRDAAIALLKAAHTRLAERSYEGLDAYFAVPKGADPAALAGHAADLIAKNEISAEGIDLLAERGVWGEASQVLGAERAERFAKRFGADVAKCRALASPPAEVVFCPNGDGQQRIVRLDDVGKLR